MNHRQIRSWTVIIVTLIVFTIFLAPNALTICQMATTESTKPLIMGGTGVCLEFWINRYQALIGVLAAIVAAGAAWRSTNRQIKRADEQIRIAQIHFSAAHIDNIRMRIDILNNAKSTVIEIFNGVRALEGDIRGLKSNILFVFANFEPALAAQYIPTRIDDWDNFVRVCDSRRDVLENTLRSLPGKLSKAEIGEASRNAIDQYFEETIIGFASVDEQITYCRFFIYCLKIDNFEDFKGGKFGPDQPIRFDLVFANTMNILLNETRRLERLYEVAADRADGAIVH